MQTRPSPKQRQARRDAFYDALQGTCASVDDHMASLDLEQRRDFMPSKRSSWALTFAIALALSSLLLVKEVGRGLLALVHGEVYGLPSLGEILVWASSSPSLGLALVVAALITALVGPAGNTHTSLRDMMRKL